MKAEATATHVNRAPRRLIWPMSRALPLRVIRSG